MNYLSTEKRVAVLQCLVEGCSLRATARMTGVAKDTVVRVLVQAGQVCSDYQDRAMHDLPCRRLEADEIWSFVYAKGKNLPYAVAAPARHAGDTWTWIVICADTKLILTWRVGTRTLRAVQDFINDLKPRLKHRVQLTTDGHSPYLEAVEGAFGAGIDYAQLIKVYGNKVEEDGQPTKTKFIEKRIITGDPDEGDISTSYVERQNVTMRMQMRRFEVMRLDNGPGVAPHWSWFAVRLAHLPGGLFPLRARGYRDLRNGGKTSQRLAPESQCEDLEQIGGGLDLACCVPLECEGQVLLRDPTSVVGDSDPSDPALLDLYEYLLCSGIYGVLDELLDGGGWAFDDFARGKLIGDGRREHADTSR